jgi:hypothetical protein
MIYFYSRFDAVLLTKELISKKTHSKVVSDLNNLISNASDYAQERLVNLLEAKFKVYFSLKLKYLLSSY